MGIIDRRKAIKGIKWFVMIALVCVLSFAGLLLFSNHENFENNNPELSTLVDVYYAIQSENSESRKEELEILFAKKLSENSLDSLISIISIISDSTYYQQVLDTIEFRALNGGVIPISKVYKSGIDKEWGAVVESEILELINVIPLTTHKELLGYYLNTDYYKAFTNSYLDRIDGSLSKLRYELIDSLLNDTDSIFSGNVKNTISSIYEDFLGGTLGWNNIKNNVFRSQETTNKLFLQIWNNKISEQGFENKFKCCVDIRLKHYYQKYDSLCFIIDYSKPVTRIDKSIKIYPNMDVMSFAVDKKLNRFYKNSAVETVGLITLPLGGWAAVAAFAGEATMDFGLDYIEQLKDPEKYFIESEHTHVCNLFTNKLSEIDKLLEDADSKLINDLKLDLQ